MTPLAIDLLLRLAEINVGAQIKKVLDKIWAPIKGAINKPTLSETAQVESLPTNDTGTYFSSEGVSLEQRAMSPEKEPPPLRSFRVLKPFAVEKSNVTPWFGQSGLGSQGRSTGTIINDEGVTVPLSVKYLIQEKYIEEI